MTACALTPLQEHVRRVLHLAGISWHAAVVSLVQVGGVLIWRLAQAATLRRHDTSPDPSVLLAIVGLVCGVLTAVPWWGNPVCRVGAPGLCRRRLGPGDGGALCAVRVADHPSIGSFARPLGVALFGAVLLLGYGYHQRLVYGAGDLGSPTRTNERVGSGRDPTRTTGSTAAMSGSLLCRSHWEERHCGWHAGTYCPRGVVAGPLVGSTRPSGWADGAASSHPVLAHPGVSWRVP
jgi:hypothetical protein